MEISRISNLSGIKRTKTMPVTQAQLDSYYIEGKFIQEAFPNLNASDREFILTGVTDEEWEEMFME